MKQLLGATLVVTCAAYALDGHCSTLWAQATGAVERRSVWDRVYTDAQASRGESLYAKHCELCHGSGLDGDAVSEVPALVADTFMQRWNGRTLDDLMARMVRSMPQASPGSLARVEYADLLAYLLKANGFPAGFEALGTDTERLARVVLQRSRP